MSPIILNDDGDYGINALGITILIMLNCVWNSNLPIGRGLE
jgi:hypothetical protein